MGQERNAISLAHQRWDVNGLDPSKKGVAPARETARNWALHFKAEIQRDGPTSRKCSITKETLVSGSVWDIAFSKDPSRSTFTGGS